MLHMRIMQMNQIIIVCFYYLSRTGHLGQAFSLAAKAPQPLTPEQPEQLLLAVRVQLVHQTVRAVMVVRRRTCRMVIAV